MAKPTPSKPLEEMTKPELFELAQELQIPGRHDMKKDELLAAVENKLTEPDELTPEQPPAPENGERPPEVSDTEPPSDAGEKTNPVNEKPSAPPDDPAAAALLEAELLKEAEAREAKQREEDAAEAVRQEQLSRAAAEKKVADRAAAHAAGRLTEDDLLEIMRASDADLVDFLDDKKNPAPEFVRVALVAEQQRRKTAAVQAKTKALVKSPNKQYRITKGPANMRYVTPTAYVTSLPLGSIITPLAHDLVHVQEQGFEWEEVKGVELTEDQLGNKISTAK